MIVLLHKGFARLPRENQRRIICRPSSYGRGIRSCVDCTDDVTLSSRGAGGELFIIYA